MLYNRDQDYFKLDSSNQLISAIQDDEIFDSSPNTMNDESSDHQKVSNYQNQFTDSENSLWLLETIKSLCRDCQKPYKYKEIKKELKQRGIIKNSSKFIMNKEIIPNNENSEEQSNEHFLQRDLINGSPFPQVYSTLDVISQNHYSKILKVQNLIDKQIYALKIMTVSEDEIASAIHEVQCLAHLQSSRSLRYFSSWIEQNPNSQSLSFYIQTEFLDKNNLKNFIKVRKNDTFKTDNLVHKIFVDIATALSEIHQAGIVHRDLQPSNLMFRSDNSVAIVGFSISSSIKNRKQKIKSSIIHNAHSGIPADHKNSSLDEFCINAAETATKVSNRNIGSPIYASPQQLNGRKSCPFDDIYSFGIIMFEMLANFESEIKRKDAIKKLRNNSVFPEKFEEEFIEESKLILQMTCHDPSKRLTAAQILQTDLFQNWKKEL